MLNLKNKKVLVMGLGLHGGGVAAATWLVKQGAKVTVTDLKNARELKPSLDIICRRRCGATSPSGIKFVLGKHRAYDFKNADIVVQNPGVPNDSKYLAIARSAGAKIENDASLFFKNCPAKIIGVTGTRGKSTTSTLIYKLLQNIPTKVGIPTSLFNADFHNQKQKLSAFKINIGVGTKYKIQNTKVWLAGLPQKPELEIIDKVKKDDIVILELSSWQLEILGQNKLSPHLAVITNIYPDHLNRYQGMADYIAAKKNIFLYQKKENFCVLNLDNEITKKFGREVLGHRYWFSKKYFSEENGCFVKNDTIYFRTLGQEQKFAKINDIKLVGQHNLENVLAALAVAAIFKIPSQKVKEVLTNFSGLPHRLELVKIIKGIKYINDTAATTPDGTMAALKTLESGIRNQESPRQNSGQAGIILIAGGASKNIPENKYIELAKLIKNKCKVVILFEGDGSKQIINQLKKLNYKSVVVGVRNMIEAVSLARSFAKQGDIILLSPASASFGIFVNEFERGEQFKEIVLKL